MSLLLTADQLIEATLTTKTPTPQPVVDKALTFKHRLAGTTDYSTDGTTPTDALGKATLKVSALEVGKVYDFRVESPEDAAKGLAAGFGERLGYVVVVGVSVSVSVKPA